MYIASLKSDTWKDFLQFWSVKILASKMEVTKKLQCLIRVVKFHRSSYTPKKSQNWFSNNLESVLKGNSPIRNED